MKKKQIKHFVVEIFPISRSGIPACNLGAYIFDANGTIAKTRRGVTCGNCRRTRIFRKLK